MNSFGTRAGLTAGGRTCEIHRLPSLGDRGMDVSRLPYSLRILLHIYTVDHRSAAIDRAKGFNHLKRRRIACAVWTEKAKHPTIF